jgi:Ca2+-binding EF-hand superfamily protein
MITLVQFVTGDSMHQIYLPFIKHDPYLAIYFFSLILVVSIVMMNLVTAVIVNTALEEASKDKEIVKAQQAKERKLLIKEMGNVFHRLDSDKSGTLSIAELQEINGDDRNLISRACMSDDLLKVFRSIDIDNSGLLSIDEFCDGVYEMSVSQKSLEMRRIERQVESLYKMVHVSIEMQKEMCMLLSTSGTVKTSRPSMETAIESATSLLEEQSRRPSRNDVSVKERDAMLGVDDIVAKETIERLREIRKSACLFDESTTVANSDSDSRRSTERLQLMIPPSLGRWAETPEWAAELIVGMNEALSRNTDLTQKAIDKLCDELVAKHSHKANSFSWDTNREMPLEFPEQSTSPGLGRLRLAVY